MILPVVLSGGSGTRLWPLSRELYPKQFLPLCSDNTMIQETLLRLDGLPTLANPIIVCNESHRFLAAEQLRLIDTDPESIILEPCGRNTAPAIAAAAMVAKANKDLVMLVLPADHVIRDVESFQKTISIGVKAALSGKLVTFGIVPNCPETGYGYIKADTTNGTQEFAPIEKFVEKPNLQTAETYLKDGSYYWNSGMFMFKPSTFLSELEKLSPEVSKATKLAVDQAQTDADFFRLDATEFAGNPSISIDYAIMEKTDKAVVIPLDAKWDDVGSWSALADVHVKDGNGNVTRGEVILEDSKDTFVHSSSRLVATVGIENLIVVETADAVLVSSKDKVQDVKKIVEKLKASGKSQAENHLKVSRPWGTYETVDTSNRYLVKRITVKPGARLSLQMHHHRAEHWIVVKGTAKITKGEETFLLTENQSTYISLGTTHRLENPGKIQLELIEVQSGGYLAEDDIIRLEDNYGRN